MCPKPCLHRNVKTLVTCSRHLEKSYAWRTDVINVVGESTWRHGNILAIFDLLPRRHFFSLKKLPSMDYKSLFPFFHPFKKNENIKTTKESRSSRERSSAFRNRSLRFYFWPASSSFPSAIRKGQKLLESARERELVAEQTSLKGWHFSSTRLVRQEEGAYVPHSSPRCPLPPIPHHPPPQKKKRNKKTSLVSDSPHWRQAPTPLWQDIPPCTREAWRSVRRRTWRHDDNVCTAGLRWRKADVLLP